MSKLYKSQEKVLKAYRDSGGKGNHYYALPPKIVNKLESIRDSETLWSDVNMWLWYNPSTSKNPYGGFHSSWDAESFGAESEIDRYNKHMDEILEVKARLLEENIGDYDPNDPEQEAENDAIYEVFSKYYPDIYSAESFGAEGIIHFDDEYYRVRCNKCMWEGEEEDLVMFEDEDGFGKGCPKCETDAYLIDVEEYEAESFGAEYGKRQRFGNRYIGRDTKGKFISNVSVGRSLKADRRTKSKTPARSGFGHKGDTQKGASGGFKLPTDAKSVIGIGAVLGGLWAYLESKA